MEQEEEGVTLGVRNEGELASGQGVCLCSGTS